MSTTTARPADALREGDTPAEAAPSGAARRVGGIAGWVDDRTGAAKPVGYLMKKVFPDHWSFMLGEIAMYSMIICLITGAFLTFWFVPSAGHTVYDGSFVPLRGVGMSEAYASTLNISFDIKGGLIIRQIHTDARPLAEDQEEIESQRQTELDPGRFCRTLWNQELGHGALRGHLGVLR